MDPEDELIQITERALYEAEEALRLDPSERNQRRVMEAWTAVRRARDRAGGDPPPRRSGHQPTDGAEES